MAGMPGNGWKWLKIATKKMAGMTKKVHGMQDII